MIRFILICLIIPVFAETEIGGFKFTKEQLEAMETGLAQWRKFAAEAPHLPLDEAIPKLAHGIHLTSISGNYVVGDKSGTNRMLRAALISIPNHADVFRNMMSEVRRKKLNHETNDPNSDRRLILGVMEQLPSVEIVKFLIEMLDDNKDFEIIEGGRDGYTVFGNDSMAATSIMILIGDLPLEKDRWGYYREDIPALQAWGREVLEGKRTFRFKDEPGVYNIHGRIREERREPSLPPLPAASGQDGMAGEKDASSPGVRWATLAALLVLFAVAAKVFFFSRRSA